MRKKAATFAPINNGASAPAWETTMTRVASDTPSQPTRVARHSVAPVMSRIDDFSAITGIGRTQIYQMIGDGTLKSVIVAGRRLIPTSEAQRLLDEALAKAAA